jgi:hypothetical protein
VSDNDGRDDPRAEQDLAEQLYASALLAGEGALPAPPDDLAVWSTARSLTDLGELTAQFLEGKLSQTPSNWGPPDPETTALVPVLAATNRAGFVTDMSQPGQPAGEDGWEQRADVSGFAGDEAFVRLMAAAAGSDLIITAARAGHEDSGPLYCITRQGKRENTWDGGAETRKSLRNGYGQFCDPQVADALCAAWQVTLIDPEWGRNDVLWAVLEQFADTQPA